MAKLCFAIRPNGGDREVDFPSAGELSFYRDSRSNLLGSVRLSRDGVVKIGNNQDYQAVDAYFLQPDCCYKVEDSVPRLILDTDADSLFASLCAKYSNVVKIQAPRIAEDNVRATVKLCAEGPEGLKGIFGFISDALSSGIKGLDSFTGAYKTDSILTLKMVSACGKFIDRYIDWYIKRAAISGAASLEGGVFRFSTQFFTSSLDGLALLHDEREYGVLSLLLNHAKSFPCMSKELHRAFVSDASKVIGGMEGITESFNDSEFTYLSKRSFANACAAGVSSSGALTRSRLVKHVEEFLESGGGVHSKETIKEVIEALAIDKALAGSDDTLSLEDLDRITGIDEGFLETCKKYEHVASRLKFPSGYHISIADAYEPEIQDVSVLSGFLSMYNRAYDLAIGQGLSGSEILGNALSGKPWSDEQKQKVVKTAFADFCLAEVYFRLLTAEPTPSQVNIISFGDRVMIDSRMSGIHVGGYGDVVPADDVLMGKIDKTAVSDTHSYGKKRGAEFIRKYCFIVTVSVALVALISVVVLICVLGVVSSAVVPWLLVPVALIAVVAIGCSAAFPILPKDKAASGAKNPELYLCINSRNETVFRTFSASSNPSEFGFNGNSLSVDGSTIPSHKYKISLVDSNAALPDRCTLFRIEGAEGQKEGLALLSALASTAGSMKIAKLSITAALPSLKAGYVLKCQFQLATRESYLRLLEVFAKANRPEISLAYLDSYVSIASMGKGCRGLSEDFLKCSAYRLLCNDQSYWRTFDTILEHCSEHIVGDRKEFVDNIVLLWKNNKEPVRGLFSCIHSLCAFSPGFPFDHQKFSHRFELADKDFDSFSQSFSEEVLVDFVELFHSLDGKRLSQEEAVERDRGESIPGAMTSCSIVGLQKSRLVANL